MGDEEREVVLRMSRAQRRRVRQIGQAIIDMASEKDLTPVMIVSRLEETCREVTGFELRDFRVRVLCANCGELFTSAATRREHYLPGSLFECTWPGRLPRLTLKSGGRWGWSDVAIEEFSKAGKAGRRGRQ